MDLTRFVDEAPLRGIMDAFHGLTGLSVGIAERDGHVTPHAGCPEICSRFHRVQPSAGIDRGKIEEDFPLRGGISICGNGTPRFKAPFSSPRYYSSSFDKEKA